MDDYENIIHENQDNTNAKSPDPFLASLLDGFEGYLCDEYELPEETLSPSGYRTSIGAFSGNSPKWQTLVWATTV